MANKTKARLVARGDPQRANIGFGELFYVFICYHSDPKYRDHLD